MSAQPIPPTRHAEDIAVRRHPGRWKWDHDEGLRLYAAGLSIPAIARLMGVSDASVRLVVDPAYRRACRESMRRSRKVNRCEGCGAMIWKAQPGWISGRLCRRCAAAEQATSIRPDSLRCSACGDWKADEDFPHRQGRIARRGRHGTCRGCQARVRQEHRERHKVPCVGCGAPTLPPSEKPGRGGVPRCRACFHEDQRRIRDAARTARDAAQVTWEKAR